MGIKYVRYSRFRNKRIKAVAFVWDQQEIPAARPQDAGNLLQVGDKVRLMLNTVAA